MIRLSVIIPTYNRSQALRECLSALAQQDYTGWWEVVVVDDGSAEPVTSVAAEFAGRLRLTLLTQPNQGPARARNFAAAHAQGDFLAFTDDDCLPHPDWLQVLAARLEVGVMVGGKTQNLLSDNRYAETSQQLVTYLYEAFADTPWYFFTSNNFAVDRATFLEMGGFDESFPTSAGEDREFCVRWQHRGHTLRYVPEAIMGHAHPLTRRTFWRQHAKYGAAARTYQQQIDALGVPSQKPSLSFYWGLLRHFARTPGLRLLALAILSQLATVWGYARGKV